MSVWLWKIVHNPFRQEKGEKYFDLERVWFKPSGAVECPFPRKVRR